MAKYIKPVSLVAENGRPIEFKRNLSETQSSQGSADWKLCVVAEKSHGKIAMLIENDWDFDCAFRDHANVALYSIGPELAKLAV